MLSGHAEILAIILPVSHHPARPMKYLLHLATSLALVAASSHAAERTRSKRESLLPPVQKPTEPATPGKLYTTSLGGKDLRFLSEAIEHGLGQVFLANLAASHAQSDRVKALASVLSQTQREENSKLSRLAAMKDVALGDRDAAAQEGFTRKFSQLPKEKFDDAWIEEVVALNQKAVPTTPTPSRPLTPTSWGSPKRPSRSRKKSSLSSAAQVRPFPPRPSAPNPRSQNRVSARPGLPAFPLMKERRRRLRWRHAEPLPDPFHRLLRARACGRARGHAGGVGVF